MAVSSIRHASAFKPLSVPVLGDVAMDNWDRVQSFAASTTQPQENLYELGRLDKMAVDKDILEATLSMSQFEYGEVDAFLQIANLAAEPSGGFSLSDFDAGRLDFISPGKDIYGGTVEQTLWLEHMSLDSLGLEINADDRLVRNFEFSGESAKIARNANKYVIFKENDAPSGTSGSYAIVLSDPAPVVNPNVAGEYILKVYRIRAGVATELVLTTDYTWTNGTTTLTILAGLADDNYRIWYTAGSYGSAGDPEVLNDADDYYLRSENVTVTIDDGTHTPVELTALTSLSISATFNRIEEAVIGTNVKIKDTESYDVAVSLGGFVKSFPIEEALMGQAGQSWGIIDYSLFAEVDVIVKIYGEAAKTSFIIGYKVPDAVFADSDANSFDANSFGSGGINLGSDSLVISTDISDM
jgi:hypothetical protein